MNFAPVAPVCSCSLTVFASPAKNTRKVRGSSGPPNHRIGHRWWRQKNARSGGSRKSFLCGSPRNLGRWLAGRPVFHFIYNEASIFVHYREQPIKDSAWLVHRVWELDAELEKLELVRTCAVGFELRGRRVTGGGVRRVV